MFVPLLDYVVAYYNDPSIVDANPAVTLMWGETCQSCQLHSNLIMHNAYRLNMSACIMCKNLNVNHDSD